MSTEQVISLEYDGTVAIITIANEHKLNALTQDQYYHLGSLLREVAKQPSIYITLLIGKGRYFSAGADVSVSHPTQQEPDIRRRWLQSFVSNNLDISRSFYNHPKILVTALNGPVIGLSAALVAFSDFIYATPRTFLLTPFTSLGLVAEGGASLAFVQRLGIAKANEALIMSKRITADELVQVGFVNKIFNTGYDDQRFRTEVMKEIRECLGSHLSGDSLLKVKALIRKPQIDMLDKQNVAEVFGGLERLVAGIPQEEFRRVSSGQKRHKL